MKVSRAILFLLFCAVVGCTDFGNPNIPPLIEPGIGIDGVRIGCPREKAKAILGSPDGGGIWDGIFGGGPCDFWTKGPHAGLQVYYRDYFQGTMPLLGPADVIVALSPYAGTTREGIGPGSRLDALLRAYAAPLYTSIDSTGKGLVVYCNAGRYTEYLISGNLVYSVAIGYNDPPAPGILPYYCH